MRPIDVASITRGSFSPENSWLVRQVTVPTCDGDVFGICGGPDISTIFATRAVVDLPSAMRWWLHMKSIAHVDGSTPNYVRGSLPIQFQIESGKTDRRGRFTFPVAVFIDKIDMSPDSQLMHWVFYGRGRTSQREEQYDRGTIVVRGCFAVCCPEHEQEANGVPEELRDGKLHDCVIVYVPGCHGAMLGVIKKEKPHLPQILKDYYVLADVLRAGFQGGFFEMKWSIGSKVWGKLASSLDASWFMALAVIETDGDWRYSRGPEHNFRVPFENVVHIDKIGYQFVGDAILCTDETILCTYWKCPRDSKKPVACYVRFYPPDSSLVPDDIIASYNANMPDHYRQILLEQNANI